MFRTAFRLPVKILGIPLKVDLSFLIILPLLAWIIGSNVPAFVEAFRLGIDPEVLASGLMPYWLGLAAAVGLFASVVIHELGHAVVGMRLGLKVKDITLWLLGGVARFADMPRRQGREAIVAVAGPATSFGIAMVLYFLLPQIPPDQAALRFLTAYLLVMNLVVGAFNLLPAIPLDGGRILRSLLALRFPYLQATRISAGVSRTLAVLLGLVGFATLSPFLMLIAFFVFMAVSGETTQATMREVLEHVPVTDVMAKEVESVRAELAVGALLDRMLEDGYHGYPVLDAEGRLAGMVTLEGVKRRKRAGQIAPDTRVGEIMSTGNCSIPASATAFEAFQKMAQDGGDRIAVIDADRSVRGIISKTDLLRSVQVRDLERELAENA